jgi:uncharacterized protein YukE
MKMTDIVKRLRAAAELDPWYHEVNEAADEIERLRDALKTFADNVKELNAGIDKNWAKTINPLKAENQRLRQQVADLVEALRTINKWQPSSKTQPRQKIIDSMQFYAHLSIVKATGGE